MKFRVKKFYIEDSTKEYRAVVGTFKTGADIVEALYNDVPIFIGELREDYEAGIKFWCPHCKEWHYHSQYEGYRRSHCMDGPLVGKDYIIILPQSERDKFPEIYNDEEHNKEITEVYTYLRGIVGFKEE